MASLAAYQQNRITMTPIDREYFTDQQVAAMLGLHPVTVRKWRSKNKSLGLIKHGPPYEYRGAAVVYPKTAFHSWCSQVQMVGGVPRINLPVTANVPLPEAPAAKPLDPRQMSLLEQVNVALTE